MHFRAKLIDAFINTVLPEEGFHCPSLSACVWCIWFTEYSGTHHFQGGNCGFCSGTLNVELI